jgi:2-dehydropantoate 2-reductase
MPPSQPKIYILGLGNLARLLAHSLAHPPPQNHHNILPWLIFHRPSLEQEWEDANRSITIVRHGEELRRQGIGRVHLKDLVEKKERIEHLIVATKAHQTVQALRPLRACLGRGSTLLFLQNGIGMFEDVFEGFRGFRYLSVFDPNSNYCLRFPIASLHVTFENLCPSSAT